MNLICDSARPPLILSYGRSGSMLLAHDVGQANNCNPVTIPDNITESDFKEGKFLEKYNNANSAIHSHRLYSAKEISAFNCFFSLRKNPIDTILSFIFATHFNLYHVLSGSIVDLKPFLFTNWPLIDHRCKSYIKWCQHYAPMLNRQHQIIYYEEYVNNLGKNVVYQPTFLEKKSLLINYHEVYDYILKFNKDIVDAQLPFESFGKNTNALIDSQ